MSRAHAASQSERVVRFIWDPRKASDNRKKHGVSFEEAASVVEGILSATSADPDHSLDEARWITIGTSSGNRLLIVAHAERGDVIRIISARLATRSE